MNVALENKKIITDKVPEPPEFRNPRVLELDKVLAALSEFNNVDSLRLKIIAQRGEVIKDLRQAHERMVVRIFPSLNVFPISGSVLDNFSLTRRSSVLEGEAIRLLALKAKFKKVGSNRLDRERLLFRQYSEQYDFGHHSFEEIELIAKASLESVSRQFLHALNRYIPAELRQPLQIRH